MRAAEEDPFADRHRIRSQPAPKAVAQHDYGVPAGYLVFRGQNPSAQQRLNAGNREVIAGYQQSPDALRSSAGADVGRYGHQ